MAPTQKWADKFTSQMSQSMCIKRFMYTNRSIGLAVKLIYPSDPQNALNSGKGKVEDTQTHNSVHDSPQARPGKTYNHTTKQNLI